MKAATSLRYAKLMGTLFFWRLNIVLWKRYCLREDSGSFWGSEVMDSV